MTNGMSRYGVLEKTSLGARKWAAEEFFKFKQYIESDEFEGHIDAFAAEIGINFVKVGSESELQQSLLDSKSRKIRIGIKLKWVTQKCGRSLLEAASAGAIAGEIFGSKGSAIGAVAMGSFVVFYYAAILYGVLERDRLLPILISLRDTR